MQKPKEFLFVGDNWDIDTLNQKDLLNYGVRIIDSDEFVKQLNKGKSFAHQFLFYNDTISKEAEAMPLSVSGLFLSSFIFLSGSACLTK